MRARQRHLNPRFAGAQFVLDSRYINQSDSTAVSTWSDRSGNAYDATQATSTRQPTFRTGIRGGNGVVRFDGNSDWLRSTVNSATVIPDDLTYIFTLNQTATSFYGFVLNVYGGTGRARGVLRANPGNGELLFEYSGGAASVASTAIWALNTWYILTIKKSGSDVSFYFSGAFDSTKTATFLAPTATTWEIGNGGPNLNLYYPGDLGQMVVVNSALSDALRKRIERGQGYSFKVACS